MMSLLTSRSLLRLAVVVAFSVFGVCATAGAQAKVNVGRGKCVDCHDHKDEKEWSQTRDGDGKGKQHFNALNQLGEAKAPEYAKAIGVGDPYDVKSTCVKCHATVVRGSADDGVTCESCHGPGSGYLVPHQSKGSYAASIPLGMKDVVKKPAEWTRDCIVCHVLGANAGDDKLAAAGHPTGKDFDVSKKYAPVALHFQSKYTANEVASAAGNVRQTLLAKLGGGGGAAPAAPAPAPAAAAPAAPAPAAPAPAAAAPAAATPAPAAPAAPAAAAPAPGKAAAAPATPAPAPAATAAARPPAAPAPGLPRAAAPPPPAPTAGAAAPVAATPAAPAVTDAPAAALPPEPALPTTPAGIVASVQGRVAALLDRLLGSGVKTPNRVTPPARKTVYRGPDADLLRLQEEVIALAIEALGTAPAPKAAPQQ